MLVWRIILITSWRSASLEKLREPWICIRPGEQGSLLQFSEQSEAHPSRHQPLRQPFARHPSGEHHLRSILWSMRKSMDVKDTTIRLSVGLEDMDDLFEDIKQAVNSL